MVAAQPGIGPELLFFEVFFFQAQRFDTFSFFSFLGG
jgi:hypothetical protein